MSVNRFCSECMAWSNAGTPHVEAVEEPGTWRQRVLEVTDLDCGHEIVRETGEWVSL